MCERERERERERGWSGEEPQSEHTTRYALPSFVLTWDRKAFPSPAPSAAPLMRPAMSTRWRNAGYFEGGSQMSQSCL